jgi:hypothetical protein
MILFLDYMQSISKETFIKISYGVSKNFSYHIFIYIQ